MNTSSRSRDGLSDVETVYCLLISRELLRTVENVQIFRSSRSGFRRTIFVAFWFLVLIREMIAEIIFGIPRDGMNPVRPGSTGECSANSSEEILAHGQRRVSDNQWWLRYYVESLSDWTWQRSDQTPNDASKKWRGVTSCPKLSSPLADERGGR